jgi:uncharacterized membrane protein YeiH
MLHGAFELPIYIDLSATLLFGLTGALAAMKRGYDWVGIFALAFTTAVGGGVIRDGILISQGPPAVTRDSRYILVILVAVGVAFVLRHHIHRFNKLIAVLDALGLGAYGVVGVQKALNAELSPAAAILVGVVNAAGGGVLRDVLVRDEPLIFKPGQFYALAALAGCLLFAFLTLQLGMQAAKAAAITILLTFIFRVLAIYYNWQTRPVWEPPASGDEPTKR